MKLASMLSRLEKELSLTSFPRSSILWKVTLIVAMAAGNTASFCARAQTGLTLHDAITRALATPASRIAAEQVQAAKGELRQAGLAPNPRLYLSTEDVQPWANHFSFANSTEDFGYLGQTFELDGKRSKRVLLANANLRRTEAETSLSIHAIAGRVAEGYWSAVATQGVADLLTQDLHAVDEVVDYHSKRVDAGAMRGVDLLRMQIERDRVFVAHAAAQREASLARLDLFRQVGLPSSSSMVLSESLSTIEAIPAISIEAAISLRADVTAAHEALGAAEADLKLQLANSVPDPDVLLGYKRNSGTDTVFASLQIPLPFRNRNQGEIDRAQANLGIARAQLEQANWMARADIEAATENYQVQEKVMRHSLPDIRERAKRNLGIMNDAYRTGGVDLLRYIDAERTEIDVEVNALRILSDYHQSALKLRLAYGGEP